MSEYTSNQALNVLFLSADTGGGHRASAESLAAQFQLQFPGSTYSLLNVLADASFYSNMEELYKDMSSHPNQWKAFYYFTNTPAISFIGNMHIKLAEEPKIREKIKRYNPDVVVSVHPLMNSVPLISCRKIAEETGKPLPFFTVVTDLGSGHALWFANQAEKIFVASEQIKAIAKLRGKVPDEKFVDFGLPIRHDFALQAANLGDRTSEAGREYQHTIRMHLGLTFPERKTLLVMGGGEGVGSLSNIVDALYAQCVAMNIDVNIFVVCGRNTKLKQELEVRDWDYVMYKYHEQKIKEQPTSLEYSSSKCFTKTNSLAAINGGCFDQSITNNIKRILSNTSMSKDVAVSAIRSYGQVHTQNELNESNEDIKPDHLIQNVEDEDHNINEENEESSRTINISDDNSGINHYASVVLEDDAGGAGNVQVIGLGFVTNMAEYMVAADILVSKAGPGTIAEAASLSLPIMLTNFLPGQEEGNVDFVIEGGFGSYASDASPYRAAEQVGSWLLNEQKLQQLSENAKKHGKPHAAAHIVRLIGNDTIEMQKHAVQAQEKKEHLLTKETDQTKKQSSVVPVVPAV